MGRVDHGGGHLTIAFAECPLECLLRVPVDACNRHLLTKMSCKPGMKVVFKNAIEFKGILHISRRTSKDLHPN